MQRALGDERVVVFPRKVARLKQGPGDATDSLELRSAITYALLVDSECLCEELVGDLFVRRLVCYLAAGEKQTEAQISH